MARKRISRQLAKHGFITIRLRPSSPLSAWEQIRHVRTGVKFVRFAAGPDSRRPGHPEDYHTRRIEPYRGGWRATEQGTDYRSAVVSSALLAFSVAQIDNWGH